jgi:biopolymer transport protein ExbD
MPKVKVPRKSTVVDMTAMTDVAFLLLTFFMLATKFKPDEPVIVDTPSSTSEIVLPETGIMQITISADGRVFFGIDDQNMRGPILRKVGEKFNVDFTNEEVKEFSLLTTVGVPVKNMSEYLRMSSEERSAYTVPGIPADSLHNELGEWIWQARMANNDIRVAIKGDKSSKYPVFKQVVQTLKQRQVYRYNFITNLEAE